MKSKIRQNVLLNARRRRRRQRDARHVLHETSAHVAETEIIRTKVVTPLRYAVALIDDEIGETLALVKRAGETLKRRRRRLKKNTSEYIMIISIC